MPTLPLLSDPTHPNASHRVLAPGGYESWNFHAVSDDGRLKLSAALHETRADDVKYLRRNWLYQKFPTRVAPPDPRAYSAVTFALFEAGHQPVRFVANAARDEVRTRDDGNGVRIGGSHFERAADGSFQLHLRGASYQRTLSANFTFRPVIESTARVDLTDDARHRAMLISPLCDVEGEVSVFSPTGGSPRVASFAGSGAHDHTFGTRSPGGAGDTWWTGRALFDNAAFSFTQLDHHDATLVIARKDATGEVTVEIRRVPVEHRAHEICVGPLHLARPCVLDSGTFETVSSFDAIIAGEQGRALCTRVNWKKLSNPVWNWLFG